MAAWIAAWREAVTSGPAGARLDRQRIVTVSGSVTSRTFFLNARWRACHRFWPLRLVAEACLAHWFLFQIHPCSLITLV